MKIKMMLALLGMFFISIVTGSMIQNLSWIWWEKILMIGILDLGLILFYLAIIIEEEK